MKRIVLLSVVLALFSFMNINQARAQKATPEALENLKAFPESLDGMDRYVIFLDKKKNEDQLKVEIQPGKTMEVDCNVQRLLGQLVDVDVEGWGYTYYKFESKGEVVSTMMFCPDPKKPGFVYGESKLLNYNSRLPIVVYVPKGMALKYKIWSAGKEKTAMLK